MEENNEEQELEQQELVEQANEAIEEQELVEMPNFQMTQSDMYFIQQHYKDLQPEALALATGLPPDLIIEYIEQYEDYLKSMGVNPHTNFNLNISLSEDGTVGYGMNWPNAKKVQDLLPVVGKLLYLINSGQLKESMSRFLVRFAEDKNQHALVNKLVQEWRKHETNAKGPIIRPHEVFSS